MNSLSNENIGVSMPDDELPDNYNILYCSPTDFHCK